MNRREFLGAAVGSAVLGAGLLEAAAPFKRSSSPFQIVPLGRTGLKTSLIGSGTGMRGGGRQSNMTRMGKEAFETLLKYQFERGVRFFDLADLYGTHPYFASAMRGVARDQYTLCTKIWTRPGKAIPEPERPAAPIVVDRFRKELNTDYIDLVQIHCMTDPKWTDQVKQYMDDLEDLKAKGIIKAHGVSIHSLEALKLCATCPWVDVVHARINAFGDSMDNKDPSVVAPVLKAIHDAGKGVIGMKLIGEGRYRDIPGKRDESIQYVLDLGSVDVMIVGFEKKEEVDDFAARTQKALKARA